MSRADKFLGRFKTSIKESSPNEDKVENAISTMIDDMGNDYYLKVIGSFKNEGIKTDDAGLVISFKGKTYNLTVKEA